MAIYQWVPTGSFEARQINSSEDLDAFIASLTPELLNGSWNTMSDFTNEGVEDGRFTLRFYLSNPDSSSFITVNEPLGWWMIANREDANVFQESPESFASRFRLADAE